MAQIGFVPPGLQDLIPVSQFYIHQTWNGIFQSYCTYNLSGPNGQLVYQAIEDRECCGPRLSVRVQNIQGYNVLNLYIPSSYCSWETKLQVSDSSGHLLGYVDRNWTAISSSFDILNSRHEICLKVKGPGWGEGFLSDQVYQVLSADKSFSVGLITCVWRGLRRDDKFVLQFPPDLDVSMKALLISCTLLIDLLQHERNRNSHH